MFRFRRLATCLEFDECTCPGQSSGHSCTCLLLLSSLVFGLNANQTAGQRTVGRYAGNPHEHVISHPHVGLFRAEAASREHVQRLIRKGTLEPHPTPPFPKQIGGQSWERPENNSGVQSWACSSSLAASAAIVLALL